MYATNAAVRRKEGENVNLYERYSLVEVRLTTHTLLGFRRQESGTGSRKYEAYLVSVVEDHLSTLSDEFSVHVSAIGADYYIIIGWCWIIFDVSRG